MYHFNEGTLALPDAWQDVTINVLSEKRSEGQGLSFTIARDTPPWGMNFAEFVQQEITRLQKQLPGFQEVGRGQLTVNGCEMISCEFTWDSTQGKMHQLIFFADAAPVVLILTATMRDELSAGQKETILALVNTLALRKM